MMKKIERTIQYWRLVDARTNNWVEDYPWSDFLRNMYVESPNPREFVVQGSQLSGKIYSIKADNLKALIPHLSDIENFNPDDDSAFIVVLSSTKDFTPNQKNVHTGDQQPMRLEGEGWEPVDNLFIYHLPFANFIAVMAESVSSKRPKVYADWLNSLMNSEGKFSEDREFRWVAEPVVDPNAMQKIKDADKLKAFVIAGEFGTKIAQEFAPMRALLGSGFSKKIDGLRVEIKVSTVRGKGSEEDQEKILDWYNSTFGSIDSINDAATKAHVTVRNSGDQATYTEVDLLQQRITRKRKVALEGNGAPVINHASALEAIIEATIVDIELLKELSI